MSTPFYENVFFVGVARIAQQGIVVASYSYNTDTDIGGVKQVLDQPNMNMQVGKHYSFSVGKLAWHLISGELAVFCLCLLCLMPWRWYFIADDAGLIYILICKLDYPQRVAHTCLEELQRTVRLSFFLSSCCCRLSW
jgi:hypothetical protein